MTNSQTKVRVRKFLNKLRSYKPYLRLHLDLGFLQLHTEVMTRHHEMYAQKYISLYWKLFKWDGELTLYKPGEDIKKW